MKKNQDKNKNTIYDGEVIFEHDKKSTLIFKITKDNDYLFY